jgi:hypothetical protein
VGGQAVRVVTQAAEVDNAAQPGPGGRLPERLGAGGVLALEVRALQRVHQVVSGLAAGHGRFQGRRVLDVASNRRADTPGPVRVPGHGGYVVPRLFQGRAQLPPHETGRSCYQYLDQERAEPGLVLLRPGIAPLPARARPTTPSR